MSLYNVDAMENAVNNGVELDSSFYSEAWWFAMTLEGTTIAMKTGDYVLQYMGWENPNAQGAYEQWSCVGRYQEWDETYEGDVYNYKYGSPLLTNTEVEANGDSIDYQTTYQTNYIREGPWTMAASQKYYTTLFRLSQDVTAMTCTGVRKVTSPVAGFNPPIDSEINMRTGFRIYTDANDQVAKHAKDYPNTRFELKGASQVYASALAVAALVIIQSF